MKPILVSQVNREIIGFLSELRAREGCGMHPDAVDHFRNVLPSLLPTDCLQDELGFPVLVHPSGLLFGIAFGFNNMCLRLPTRMSNEYCSGEGPAPAFPDWQQRQFHGLPHDWIVLRFGRRDPERCLAAFRIAGGLKFRIQRIDAGWWIWSTYSFRVIVDAEDCSLLFAVEEVGRDIVSAVQPHASKVTSVIVIVQAWHNSGAIERFHDRLKDFLSARVFVPLHFQ